MAPTSIPVVLTNFSGIELQRNRAENTIIAPSEVTFEISNQNNDFYFEDFKGGSVVIELWLLARSGDVEITSWKFRIKVAQPGYQKLKITAVDFLQSYLRGYYPNTKIPDGIFPSNRNYENEGLCVPVPFGTAYVPLRDVYITSAGYLMLGDPAFTYTISKIRSPRSWGLKSEYATPTYTFTQSSKADADLVNWRVFQAIIADTDNDGVADAAGCWLIPGGMTLDPPVQFTRSDTATMTNFADVIAFVLKDMGVPAADIDEAGTFATAHTTFDGWGLECNGAFWYKQEREKILSLLLNQCHSCLRVEEKIKLHVLVKDSQKTVTSSSVLRPSAQGEGSFVYQDIVNEDYSDGGYVSWQATGEAQDSFLKTLVAANSGSSVTVVSDEVLECPFVQDSIDVRKLGILFYQRKLLKEAEVGFLAKGSCIELQPDDVITVNDSNYGGVYVALVDSMKINPDLSIQFRCSKFKETLSAEIVTGTLTSGLVYKITATEVNHFGSGKVVGNYFISAGTETCDASNKVKRVDVFNNWADLSAIALVVGTDDTARSWQPIISGPDSAGNTNLLPDRVRIGDSPNYILLDPGSPTKVSLYDNDVEKVRLGNLNGFLDYVTNLYGIGIGETDSYLKYDTTNGLRIKGNITLGAGSNIGWSYVTNDGGRPDDSADVTFSAVNGGLTVTGGGITLSGGGSIKGGQTDYNTGTGFFLGYSSAAYKLSIGVSTGARLTWDNTTLTVVGEVKTASGVGATQKGIHLSVTDNELYFWGDGGAGIEKQASIGLTGYVTDFVVGYFGTGTEGNDAIGVLATSHNNGGLYAFSTHLYAIYATGNGSISCSGDAKFNDQILAEATGGLPPFVITSSVVNTNLNADLWDGYEFADYIDQAVKQASGPTFNHIHLSATSYLTGHFYITSGALGIDNNQFHNGKDTNGDYYSLIGIDSGDVLQIGVAVPGGITIGGSATGDNPISIKVGGATKNITIDGNGFLKGA